jgi:uracil-DNA glycosylase
MKKKNSATDYVPLTHSLRVMQQAVQSCKGCDLYKIATQAVFGEGKSTATILFVGEQPGDQEDLKGHPFVGPAGRILDKALEEAGIDRGTVYVTNAVKHFKFEERGKRRLHKKPRISEVTACRPWLEAEIEAVRPRVIVALGATAALSLTGKQVKILTERGKLFPHSKAEFFVATVHPSALLRIQDAEEKKVQFGRFVEDLRAIRSLVSTGKVPKTI